MTADPSLSPLTTQLSRPWTGTVRREVLPNGLTLLVQVDHSAPVASVVTHVRAGFFDEPDEWVGISHVLEHMFFKGTPRRGVGEIARETKAAGGYLNAHTSYDHTSYFVVLPASHLREGLDIQADALRHSTIDPDELARELQVIIQEAKRKLDSPGAVAYETLHAVMFDHHRIRRWRIGHAEQLAGFTREDVVAYYRSRYVPANTIVTIVGAVDPDEALALAQAAYGDWPAAAPAVDRSPEEPVRREVRARTLRGDVTEAEVSLGWRAPPPLDPDAPALDLAAAVLSAGRGSRLYRALREPGIVASIAAYYYAPTELGVFSVGAELEPGRIPQAVRRIAAEIARLRDEGPSDEELARARTLLLARWARQMESMDGRASALATAEALDGVEFLDREYQALTTTSAEQVRDAARKYLMSDAVSGVAYLPEKTGSDLTVEGLVEAMAERGNRGTGERHNGGTAVESWDRPPCLSPLSIAAPPSRRSAAPPVLHTALPGVDLLVRRKAGVPLVTLGVYLPRAELDPPTQAGISALAVRSAVRGAGGLDARALAFAFERLGGTLAPAVASDWLGFGTTVLSEHLGEAAALLYRVLTEPTLDEAAVGTERGIMVTEAQRLADDMFRYPFQLAFAAAFGDSGYGVPVGGLPETLAGLTAEAVRAWYHRTLAGQRATVVAVGDVEPERAAASLGAVFDAYPRAAAVKTLPPVVWAIDSRPVTRLVERNKEQSSLAMIFRGPDRLRPERFAADVWGAVAGGLGGRLFEALRSERSLAYTVLASPWQRGRAGALVTYIATSPEREDEARTAMLDGVQQFAQEAVTERELRQAVSYLAGQTEVRRQQGAAVAGEILEAWMIGTGLEELEDPAAPYRAVTASDVQAVAKAAFEGGGRAEGVVRGVTRRA